MASENSNMKRNGIEEQYVIDDFTSKDTWRIFRIIAEFVEGFEMLAKIPPAVAIFGYHGWRSRSYGGCKQGGHRSRRCIGRLEYRTAPGAEAKHLRQQASEFQVFLRTQSDVREVLYRLR